MKTKQVEGIQPSNVNTQSLNSAVCCESGKDRFARPDNHDDDDDDDDNVNDDDDTFIVNLKCFDTSSCSFPSV